MALAMGVVRSRLSPFAMSTFEDAHISNLGQVEQILVFVMHGGRLEQ